MTGSIGKYSVKGSSRPRWRYRIYVAKDATGKWQREGKGGFGKEAEANEAMQLHMLTLKTRSAAVSPAGPIWTLTTWVHHWLDHYGPTRCQPKTLERYRELAAYIAPDLGEVPLLRLTHTDLESALFALLKVPGKRRKHLSVKTVLHVAGIINVTLNKAFKLGLVPVNPMLRVELPSIERKDARSLDQKEIQLLRQACQGDWTFTLIELALACGARRGELLALTWADVDWLTRSLGIDKSLEQTRAGVRVKRPKNGRARVFRIPQSAIAALEFHRIQQQEAKRLFGPDYQDLDLIFCEPNGVFLKPHLVSQTISRRLKKAGIKNASFHSQRHSHASNLLSLGVPLPAVSARLGHSDTNVTARVYSHALPDDDDRAADAWEKLVSKVH